MHPPHAPDTSQVPERRARARARPRPSVLRTHQHTVACTRNQLRSVRLEGDGVNALQRRWARRAQNVRQWKSELGVASEPATAPASLVWLRLAGATAGFVRWSQVPATTGWRREREAARTEPRSNAAAGRAGQSKRGDAAPRVLATASRYRLGASPVHTRGHPPAGTQERSDASCATCSAALTQPAERRGAQPLVSAGFGEQRKPPGGGSGEKFTSAVRRSTAGCVVTDLLYIVLVVHLVGPHDVGPHAAAGPFLQSKLSSQTAA